MAYGSSKPRKPATYPSPFLVTCYFLNHSHMSIPSNRFIISLIDIIFCLPPVAREFMELIHKATQSSFGCITPKYKLENGEKEIYHSKDRKLPDARGRRKQLRALGRTGHTLAKGEKLDLKIEHLGYLTCLKWFGLKNSRSRMKQGSLLNISKQNSIFQ